MSKSLEDILYFHISSAGVPLPTREYKFHKTRKWRCDFFWPEYGLIVEVEGGIYVDGRHVRPKGYKNDCEKYNEAVLMNYHILRFTSDHINSLYALKCIERFIKNTVKDEQKTTLNVG